MSERNGALDGDTIERVRRIDELCDRFEEELRAGRCPSIKDFLRAEKIDLDAAGSDLLRELARLESASSPPIDTRRQTLVRPAQVPA
jgi:hypothetical protein